MRLPTVPAVALRPQLSNKLRNPQGTRTVVSARTRPPPMPATQSREASPPKKIRRLTEQPEYRKHGPPQQHVDTVMGNAQVQPLVTAVTRAKAPRQGNVSQVEKKRRCAHQSGVLRPPTANNRAPPPPAPLAEQRGIMYQAVYEDAI